MVYMDGWYTWMDEWMDVYMGWMDGWMVRLDPLFFHY